MALLSLTFRQVLMENSRQKAPRRPAWVKPNIAAMSPFRQDKKQHQTVS